MSVVGPSRRDNGTSDSDGEDLMLGDARKNRRPNARALKLTNNALEAIASSNDASTTGVVNQETDAAEDDFKFDFKMGLADRSRKYYVHPFAKTAEKWSSLVEDYPLCMATQTSVIYA